MKLTSVSFEESVLLELRELRKRSEGMNPTSIASAPTLCAVLGGGDPAVAYNAFKHAVLAQADSTQIRAASYSLGLESTEDTHLRRLDEFGRHFAFEQRQARRHSDVGLQRIAKFVATNWTVDSVPRLNVTVVQSGPDAFTVGVVLERPSFIEMRPPEFSVWVDGNREGREVSFGDSERLDATWSRSIGEHFELQARGDGEFALVVVWPGETWPKMSVQAVGLDARTVFVTETLGCKLMLRFSRVGS